MYNPEAFFKFADKAEWDALAHLVVPHEVFVVGVIHTPLVTDEEGEVVSGGEPIPGWHVNFRSKGDVPEALVPFQIFPENPRMVSA